MNLPNFGRAVWILVSMSCTRGAVVGLFTSGFRLGRGSEGTKDGKKESFGTVLYGDGLESTSEVTTRAALDCSMMSWVASLMGREK